MSVHLPLHWSLGHFLNGNSDLDFFLLLGVRGLDPEVDIYGWGGLSFERDRGSWVRKNVCLTMM